MPPERWCGTCAQHDHYPCQPVDESLCGAPDYHKWRPKECATCPLEGRVVALEAEHPHPSPWWLADMTNLQVQVAELEARLQAHMEDHWCPACGKRMTADPDGQVRCHHCEHVLEPPAAPAQRQPVFHTCRSCLYAFDDARTEPCRSCKQNWQPRQGAGL